MTIPELYYLIRTEPVCLWIGAGFSSYAGYPTGNELQKILFNDLEPHEKNQLSDIDTLSSFCEDYKTLLGKDVLYQKLQEIFSVIPSSKTTHDLLAKISHFNTIITTNYDRMIEDSYLPNEIAVVVKDSDVASALQNQCHLYKIHGDIEDKDSLILTKKEYSRHYNRNFKDPFWASIIQAISCKHVIFLGYGYEDENIWADFSHIHEKLLDKRKKRIMISRKFSPLKLKKLEEHRIVPIRSEIEQFLKGLENDIRKNLVADLNNNRVSADTAIKFANQFGVDLKLNSTSKGITVSEIANRTGPTQSQINMEIQGKEIIDRYLEFKDSYSNMEFKVKNSALKEFSIITEGFELLEQAGVKSVRLNHVPSSKGKCTIEFPAQDYESIAFDYAFYNGIQRESAIIVKILGFNIKLHFLLKDGNPKLKLTVKESKKGGRSSEYLSVYKMLCWFIDGENIILHRKGQDSVSHKFNHLNNSNAFSHYLLLLEHIIQIEKYFGIKFEHVRLLDLDEESLLTINKLVSLINYGSFRIIDQEGHTIMDIPNDAKLYSALKGEVPKAQMLYLSSPGSVSYFLFEEELDLGSQTIGLKEAQLITIDEEAAMVKFKSSDDFVVYSYSEFGVRGNTKLIWGKDD